ncbi:hypothetical protein BD309DRAFT_293584 [Dichomitus squalens]|uniref:Uncharacterized protein n=1 Tax=Dichomitus squalens TaxID=114155 RepID=A0A4Q9P2E7_9APHY|nr:hypothetical protein BD309DRAFT_293584 [Dichomitus squalens]TBU58759.1 hypothetical protein BD310DRAFT_450707 [Dichomitus squalens]
MTLACPFLRRPVLGGAGFRPNSVHDVVMYATSACSWCRAGSATSYSNRTVHRQYYELPGRLRAHGNLQGKIRSRRALRPRSTRRESRWSVRRRRDKSSALSYPRCSNNGHTKDNINTASLLIGPRTRQAWNGTRGSSVQITGQEAVIKRWFRPSRRCKPRERGVFVSGAIVQRRVLTYRLGPTRKLRSQTSEPCLPAHDTAPHRPSPP